MWTNGVYQDVFLQEDMRKYVEFCRMLYAGRSSIPVSGQQDRQHDRKMAGGLGFMTPGMVRCSRHCQRSAEKDSEARIDYITEGLWANGEWGYPYSYTPYCYLAVPSTTRTGRLLRGLRQQADRGSTS